LINEVLSISINFTLERKVRIIYGKDKIIFSPGIWTCNLPQCMHFEVSEKSREEMGLKNKIEFRQNGRRN